MTMDPFTGEIKMVGFNFAPQGYALCQGQVMPISQNAALFALLGTTFGGDGVQTYGLPDFRGRVPIGMGNGPSLTPVAQGEKSGAESVTLSQTQMPQHTHAGTASVAIPAATTQGTANAPTTSSFLAGTTDLSGAGGFDVGLYATGTPTTTLQPFNAAVTNNIAGGSLPVPIRNPYLGTNFIIALNGVFPSRN
jgi:microcystin-dependent protein